MSAAAAAPITFTIPGEARGKGRPRATTIGGHARMFTDAKTAAYENLVRLACREAMAGREALDGPVGLHLLIHVAPAKSASKKARAAMLAGDICPAKKPDITNIIKAVEDGLNTVAFRDDAQIVSLSAVKVYEETPCVRVQVRPFP